jgi:hypothetical protein
MRAAGATVATAVEIDAALAQLEQWQLLRPNISNQIGRAFEELRRSVAAKARRPLSGVTTNNRKA